MQILDVSCMHLGTLKQLFCRLLLELQTTAGGLQRMKRKYLLNNESAPVRIKALDKGELVTVGLISSSPGHAVQEAGLKTSVLSAVF